MIVIVSNLNCPRVSTFLKRYKSCPISCPIKKTA
nr:MAG TPA: hypothetical protein [Caudoviricetes sp.]